MNKDQLKAAFAKGARIQAWHLLQGATNSNQGQWDTLTPAEGAEPEFGCEAHLYRVHPEDLTLIAELGQEVGAVAPVSFAVELADGTLGALGWIDYAKFEHVKNMGTLANGARYVFAYRTSPAHTSEARDAAGLVAAAKRLDKFSLVILSSVAVEDPEFSERVGAALVDLRNAAHADPCAVKYRKALERIFDCGRFPEGHHSAGDHEFCGSHHADCIAIAREALSEDAAMRQEGGSDA